MKNLLFFMLIAFTEGTSTNDLKATIYQRIQFYNLAPSSTQLARLSTVAVDVIDCVVKCAFGTDCPVIYFYHDVHSCLCYNFEDLQTLVLVPNPAARKYVMEGKAQEVCSSKGYEFSSSPLLCFKLFTDVNEWNVSRDLCLADGTDLIILDTDDAILYMSQYLRETTSSVYWHIGMSDVNRDGLSWRWVNNQEVISTRTNFDPKDEQYCGTLRTNAEKLIDASCTVTRRRICELRL